MKTRRRTVLAGGVASILLASKGLALAENGARSYTWRREEPVWIPTRTRSKLCARLWIPEAADGSRVPVVLEYIPYRTFDRYRALDDRWGATLAQKGIAFARVDIRGSGNSEGLLLDEYLATEQEDCVDVIAWLARQSWCNGSVGMRGISWGGFSTLQVAALRPPALKAIMPMCATDNRFQNDAHYVGGAPGLTNLKWAAGLMLVMSSPPDPAVVGPRWQAMWRARLEATPSIAARWLRHGWNDAYWRHGSLGLKPEAIACPTYVVGGWADAYAQSAERLTRELPTAKKTLMGPWGHIYPDLADPGPGLDWASEEVRWWRHWLAGAQTDVMDGPLFRFFIAYATPSQADGAEIAGRWASEPSWPAASIRDKVLYLTPAGLAQEPATAISTYRAERIVGLASPEWIPYARGERPREQGHDDARSLCFDADILDLTEIVGVPRARLRVRADRPVATVAVRLCEIDAQGRSWLVTYGVLNLCFRNGLDSHPERLSPGVFYDVEVALNPVAHRFGKGSRLRLALSDGLWPLVWPAPRRATLEFALAGCSVALPERPIPAVEAAFPIPLSHTHISRGEPSLQIDERPDGRTDIAGAWPDVLQVADGVGTELSGAGPDMHLYLDPGDLDSGCWKVRQTSRYRRGDWDCETRVEIAMTGNAEAFSVESRLEALWKGKPFFNRKWRDRVQRNFC